MQHQARAVRNELAGSQVTDQPAADRDEIVGPGRVDPADTRVPALRVRQRRASRLTTVMATAAFTCGDSLCDVIGMVAGADSISDVDLLRHGGRSGRWRPGAAPAPSC